MAVVIASQVGIQVGGEPLFGDVSFKLEARDRMTLAGRNGAGKSTLLRILAGELVPDEGSLSFQKEARVALHDQRPPRDPDLTLGEYVFGSRSEMVAFEDELNALEQKMSDGSHDEATMEAYSKAQHRLEAAGGYRWRDEVVNVLRGLGFSDEHLERRLHTFLSLIHI